MSTGASTARVSWGLRSLWASRAVACAVVGQPHLGVLCTLVRSSRRLRQELAVWGPLSCRPLLPVPRAPAGLLCHRPLHCHPSVRVSQPCYRRADRAFGVPLVLLQLMRTQPAPYPLSGRSSQKSKFKIGSEDLTHSLFKHVRTFPGDTHVHSKAAATARAAGVSGSHHPRQPLPVPGLPSGAHPLPENQRSLRLKVGTVTEG